MNCDLVFDILTRGPFPSGEASDDAVERHLCACYECRQLAEALRPAVALFHESIEAGECAELPGYHGALPAESAGGRTTVVATAEGCFTRRSTRAALKRRWRLSPAVRSLAMRLAATGGLAAGLCVVMFALAGPQASDDGQTLSEVAAPGLLREGSDPRLALASLELPQDCFRLTLGAPLDRHGRALCCTNCHAAGLSRAPQLGQSLETVMRSCRLCHES
jgi:hypothetical protein